MIEILTTRANKEDIRGVVLELIRALTGKSPQYTEIANGLQLRLGMTLLAQIQTDFVTKSRGGTGRDGIKWEPLKRATIANRRPAPRKKLGERPRGLLTHEEDRHWRRVFARTKASLTARGLDDGEAGKRAGQAAWASVKAMGARTKLTVYGGRTVEILVDTGELARSFSPGVDGNVHRAEPGLVIVGTNKKTWHHRGTRRGLPARPFWPIDGNFPPAYWQPVLLSAQRGMVEALRQLMVVGKVAA